MSSRLHAVACGLVLSACLSGCAAGTDSARAPASPAASPSAQQTGQAGPSPSTTDSGDAAPTPVGKTIALSYAAGAVSGVGPRVEVPLGEPVVIRVTSDVAEEVHVHGYDLMGDVPAGGTVDIPFTADIPGVFEVELEGLGKLLFQLRVA